MERNTTQRENISRREGRWLMHERRGSYIVEAAIVVPLFIAATVLLIWIVPVMASWENVMYSAAESQWKSLSLAQQTPQSKSTFLHSQ